MKESAIVTPLPAVGGDEREGGVNPEKIGFVHPHLNPPPSKGEDIIIENLIYPRNSQAIKKIQRRPMASMENPITMEKRSVNTPGYFAR